jgi:hypothetical protein
MTQRDQETVLDKYIKGVNLRVISGVIIFCVVSTASVVTAYNKVQTDIALIKKDIQQIRENQERGGGSAKSFSSIHKN